MKLLKGIGIFLHELDEMVFPSSIYCMSCGSMIDRSRSYSLCDECIRKFHWNTGVTCDRCGKALPERITAGVDGEGAVGACGGAAGDFAVGSACGGAAGDFAVGSACGGAAPRLCYNCMIQLPLYKKGFSCVTYGLHERELMMDLKYAGHGYIARKCGDMMFDRIEAEILDGLFSPEASPIDIIVPVPVSSVRYRERGYNQSALMAAQLAKRWRELAAESGVRPTRQTPAPESQGRPVREARAPESHGRPAREARAPVLCEDMLYRTRETRKLRGLNPAERAMELEGVFKVKPGCEVKIWDMKAEADSGVRNPVRALLIDDIQTTNATANACTKALLEAGVSEVYFLSWASGGNRKPEECGQDDFV